MFNPTLPFRGSAAIRDGLLNRARLRRDFVALYRDVYLSLDVEPDLAVRSHAAFVMCGDRGVLAGYSAAQLLGAGCAPLRARPEVIVPGGSRPRQRPDLHVRYDVLAADEVTDAGGLRTTTPLRTAYDLARRLPLRSAVAALDALARCGGFAPQALLQFAERYPRARGRHQLPRVVALSDPLAESVMETRTRLALVLGGLPRRAPRSKSATTGSSHGLT
jgi:AbiEi antitoxin C-terminal domain